MNKTQSTNILQNTYISTYESAFESWYEAPVIPDEKSDYYLWTLQEIFLVDVGSGIWDNYKMTNHQIEYHLNDIALLGELAESSIVIKSRNTSFTVSSIIREIMATIEFHNVTVPFIRMGKQGANKLLKQAKDIIKHMNPIIEKEIYVRDLVTGKECSLDNFEGDITSLENKGLVERFEKLEYYPFNPAECDMKAESKIIFPNGVIWEAYPAGASAAENVRGLRIQGNMGMLDEANFMRTFEDLFEALDKAYKGADSKGRDYKQFEIGTTLKGNTVFASWLGKIRDNIKKGNKGFKIFDWPVFRRDLFEEYRSGDCKIPFQDRDDLISIVPWHKKDMLWTAFCISPEKFMEEMMGIQVDDDYQFYKTPLMIERMIREFVEEEQFKYIEFEKYDKITIGLDPATVSDFFSMSVIGHYGNIKDELFLMNVKNMPLPEMQTKLQPMFDYIDSCNSNWRATFDATPIGRQMTQYFEATYGTEHIRGIQGGNTIETYSGLKYKLNEYGHTLTMLMLNGLDDRGTQLNLIEDMIHLEHFQAISGRDFQPLKTSNGHGDSCMATMYALLPEDLKHAGEITIARKYKKKEEDTEEQAVEKIKEFNKPENIRERIKFFRKNR